MKLHHIGLFHTISSLEYSHCAFTGKTLRFPKIVKGLAQLIEYSNEGSESLADIKIVLIRKTEFDAIKDKTHTIGSPIHKLFESRLIEAMKRYVKPEDIICHPFGKSHECLLTIFPNNIHLETGIGYPDPMEKTFKCFESYAWMHSLFGNKSNSYPGYYNYVVPSVVDLDDWDICLKPQNYIAFLGRVCKDKGIDIIKSIAENTDYKIKICGKVFEDSLDQWKHPNIEFIEPISGRQRSEFLGNAFCCLMPTRFIEPFGNTAIEAMSCGTPVISVDYGAFTETIIDGVTGYRCHSLKDWIDNIEKSRELNRFQVADITRSRYNLSVARKLYEKIFKDLVNLKTEYSSSLLK